MGIEFVRGKVARISEDEQNNPIVRLELTEEGRIVERPRDMVVLSVGMVPADNPQPIFGVPVGEYGFIHIPDPNIALTVTDVPGIFAAGTAVSPMGIVDSIVTAGTAAEETAAYLESRFHKTPVVSDLAEPAMAAGRSVSYA